MTRRRGCPSTYFTVNNWIQKMYPNVSAAQLRKAATIPGRKKAPEKADRMAKFLNHSRKTADTYYGMRDRIQHAPEVHQLIGETMGTGEVLDQHFHHSDRDSPPDEVVMSMSNDQERAARMQRLTVLRQPSAEGRFIKQPPPPPHGSPLLCTEMMTLQDRRHGPEGRGQPGPL